MHREISGIPWNLQRIPTVGIHRFFFGNSQEVLGNPQEFTRDPQECTGNPQECTRNLSEFMGCPGNLQNIAMYLWGIHRNSQGFHRNLQGTPSVHQRCTIKARQHSQIVQSVSNARIMSSSYAVKGLLRGSYPFFKSAFLCGKGQGPILGFYPFLKAF